MLNCNEPVLKTCLSAAELLSGLGSRVLVTDFDGTMTAVDFFDVVLHHVPADQMPDYWARCEAGEISHVAALHGIFQQASHDPTVVESWLPETKLDPQTGGAIKQLRATGWDILVVSAGSEWYIQKLLAPWASQLRLIANPGVMTPESGLTMTWPPADVPWYSAHFGIDKSRIVQLLNASGRRVAFAGDGRPDLAAAKLVPAERRFARTWLAEQLQAAGERYQPFECWSDIAPELVAAG